MWAGGKNGLIIDHHVQVEEEEVVVVVVVVCLCWGELLDLIMDLT